MPGLDDYSSPILRMAVFRRLFPGVQVSYSVVPIGRAFPDGHYEYEGKATEAVKCVLAFPDGTNITAFKEIDKVDHGRPVPQTPENMAKNETKALGRALRDAGVPQKTSELQVLMRWIVDLDGQHIPSPGRVVDEAPAPEPDPNIDPRADDPPDAGTEDPTPEQVLAQRFARLNGADKASVSKYAREELGVNNVMRAGEQADNLLGYLDAMTMADKPEQEPEEPF